MIQLLKHITNEITPAILAAMPQTCDGASWSVKNEGVCAFATRPDEGQKYLYGPIWPTESAREFVTLDDAFDVQIAFVVSDAKANSWAGLASANRVTNAYTIQMVIAANIATLSAIDRAEYALNNCHGVSVVSISYDTQRNAQQFFQPNVDARGIDPERMITTVIFQYNANFISTLEDL